MDDPEGAAPGTGGSMDVAGAPRLHAAAAGAPVCSGPAATLGAPLRSRSPDAIAGPARGFGAFVRVGYTRKAAETLRTLTGSSQR